MTTHPVRPFVVSLLALAAAASGCSQAEMHNHDLDQNGYVFYLDGAGGGGVLTNWGNGVREGLKLANYGGDFANFPWQTGLGVGADQSASVEYKREKAAELAQRIREYMDSHPDKPVNLVGLSAGTAVAAFALEALPENHPVENVVLLGSSLSSHYDMTKALARVRGRLYVFTSEKDAVLGVAVSIAGTADRQFCGACSAGLKGFHVPSDARDDTRRLYSKITNIDWRPEFAKDGNYGGHTDAVNANFVRDYIAPLLTDSGPRFVMAGQQPRA
ncbi:MAG: hypothetical protein HS101_03920 [Planctomycetia bacterium]|nr:hypothetical protein [Planctomycetia bacterium]MCC7315986.1 hypothetical protein [Planctomycetota bacterium]